MENFTPAMETLLTEKLQLYRRLNQLLIDERQAIVNIDVDTLWENAEKKKELAGNIRQLRRQILDLVSQESGFTDMTEASFSLAYLIRTLPISSEDRALLRKLTRCLDDEKNQLAQSASDNKKYVDEYLSVIDEIMGAAVDNSGNTQYTHFGAVPDSKMQKCLIHARV